jgi:hypothetical protein
MAMKFDSVTESRTAHHTDIDYDYEHRFAEHEHDTKTEETPEPRRQPMRPNGLLPEPQLNPGP